MPRSNRVDLEQLTAHLCATTDLERNVRVNINVIGLNGRPQVMGLVEILTEWLAYRRDTVTRRLKHRLEQVLARLHVLDGLLIAYLNIDEVIRIIRTEDKPKPVMMERFGISEIQAEAILNLRLRHLMKLEEMKIRGEQDELSAERDRINELLGSDDAMTRLIASEIKADAEKYGDERKSPIVQRQAAQALSETDLLPAEPITAVLSQQGWIRAAKGHAVDAENLSYKAGDELLVALPGKTNQTLVVLDSTGRGYQLPAHKLPSARSQGEPLSGRLNPPAGASFVGMAMGAPTDKWLIGSAAGYGFITTLAELETRNKSGKAVLTVPKGSSVLPTAAVPPGDDALICVVSAEGRLLVFPQSELPELSRGKGNKMMALKGDDHIVAWCAVPAGGGLRLDSGQRHITLKASDLEATYLGKRASRGSNLPRGFQRVSAASAAE